MAEVQEQRGLWEEATPVGVDEEDGEGQRALSGWESGSQDTKPPFYPHNGHVCSSYAVWGHRDHTAFLVPVLSEESQTLVSCPEAPNLLWIHEGICVGIMSQSSVNCSVDSVEASVAAALASHHCRYSSSCLLLQLGFSSITFF